MKRIIAYLFLTLFVAVAANGQCEVIDQTIILAREEVSRGNVEGALNALRTAQGFSDLSSCPDYSRLADEIHRIESQKQASVASFSSERITVNGNPAERFTINGVSFIMVSVKGGSFQMGATSEQGRQRFITAGGNEFPVHNVTLSDYSIGQTEVTQALWQAVMGENPSHFKGLSDLPVESVSWYDCQQFIAKLNQLTGRHFRLPTEAEWEYAARGGNKSKGYKYAGGNKIDNVAWYWANSGDVRLKKDDWLNSDRIRSNHCRTHPMAQKKENELGLYDMSGNVSEWCQDWYAGNYYSESPLSNPCNTSMSTDRVCRGGWYDEEWRDMGRVSDRGFAKPDSRYSSIGLRLAL